MIGDGRAPVHPAGAAHGSGMLHAMAASFSDPRARPFAARAVAFVSRAFMAHEPTPLAIDRLRAIRRLVLITLAFESWLLLRYFPYSERPLVFATIAWALTACAAFGWLDRVGHRAVVVALMLEVATILWAFPENANHQFLAVWLLVLLALAGDAATNDRGEGAAATAAAAMRAIVAGGLLWSGVMKLVYGYWLGGEYLSYRIALEPQFARVFASVVPAAELERLAALGREIGAGPFRAEAPLLVVVSNLTWVLEIALPIGLCFERTRRLALVAALALIVAIEAGAFEIFFGGLMVGLLLLFAERERLSLLIGPIVLVYAAWLARVFATGVGGGA